VNPQGKHRTAAPSLVSRLQHRDLFEAYTVALALHAALLLATQNAMPLGCVRPLKPNATHLRLTIPHHASFFFVSFQDLLEYKKKQRVLRVRTMDGSVKTLHVDDSHIVGQLMITICSKIGKFPMPKQPLMSLAM
jgi:hypothetical protein